MNYDEYMRNVLGYSNCDCDDMYNMYEQPFDFGVNQNYYYSMPNQSRKDDKDVDLAAFYPEVYKLLNPMVCKICSANSNRPITKELLEEMTEEIYRNFEPEERGEQNPKTILKNGDVRNPNIKEPELPKETRQRNFLLRDLIQILLLTQWGRPIVGPIPPIPPPPPRPRPPYFQPQPQIPPRPTYGRPPYGNMPPPRPRYF